MTLRLCKAALVAAAGLFLLIVVLNNAVFDYRSNYEFVRHVLSMDTLFSGEANTWRALRDPTPADNSYWLHHAFYWTIIAWEATAALLCLAGAKRLFAKRAASAAEFQRAKSLAALGLAVSMLQWFVAFTTIGGEWFLMWQSKSWSGQESAFRLFTTFGVMLVLLALRDEDDRTA